MYTDRILYWLKNFPAFGFRLSWLLALALGPEIFAQASNMKDGNYMYAVQTTTGDIGVFDINNNHALVKTYSTIANGSGYDVNGVCVSKATGLLYYSIETSNGGYVVCVNLYTDKVVWNKKYNPGVDRLTMTPDGKTIFLPTDEYVTTGEKYILIVDAITGNVIKQVDVGTQSHDGVIGISGKYEYQETNSSRIVSILNTGMDGGPIQVVRTIECFGINHPLVPNGSDTYLLINTDGVHGFQVGDVAAGKVVATVTTAGDPAPDPTKRDTRYNHGIAWTPDEKEAWCTGAGNIYVFDMTNPLQPKQTNSMAGKKTGSNAHWVTFDLSGRFAYVTGGAGTPGICEVWDAKAKKFINYLPNNFNSEYLLEVDWQGGKISAVGDQYGIGRVPAKSVSIQFNNRVSDTSPVSSLRYFSNGRMEYLFNGMEGVKKKADTRGKLLE